MCPRKTDMVGVIGGRCGEPSFPIDVYGGSSARGISESGPCRELSAFFPESDERGTSNENVSANDSSVRAREVFFVAMAGESSDDVSPSFRKLYDEKIPP
jgi:hypothetical protein